MGRRGLGDRRLGDRDRCRRGLGERCRRRGGERDRERDRERARRGLRERRRLGGDRDRLGERLRGDRDLERPMAAVYMSKTALVDQERRCLPFFAKAEKGC